MVDVTASLDNATQQVLALLAQIRLGNVRAVQAQDIGAADNYVVAPVPNVSSYGPDLLLLVDFANPNTTTSPKLTIQGLATVSIQAFDGSSPAIGSVAGKRLVGFSSIAGGGFAARLLGLAAADIPPIIAPITRNLLKQPLQIYVDPRTGSDSNNGLSWATAFATAGRAWSFTVNNADLNGYQVFVNMAKGTPGSPVVHTVPLAAYAPPLGSSHGAGAVVFVGDTVTPDNALWAVTGGNAVLGQGGAQFYVAGMKLQTAGAQTFAIAAAPGSIIGFQNIDFGGCGGGHLNCNGGFLQAAGPYTISGGAPYHGVSSLGGSLILDSAAVTLTGTPNFSTAFVSFVAGGNIEAIGTTFTGSATGQRYLGQNPPGSCNTNGGGANFFPGNVAGSAPAGSYN